MSSQVISFRLNTANPDERAALEILETWETRLQERTGRRRYIMVAALHALANKEMPPPADLAGIRVLVSELAEIVATLGQMAASGNGMGRQVADLQKRANGISESLLSSMTHAVEIFEEE